MFRFEIDKIIKSLKSSYGKDFLDTITMQLHKTIGAQYTFIAKLDKERFVSQTLSLAAGDEFGENFEYSLEYTPCADVSNDTTCIYPQRICSLYPQDQLLIDMQIEGYVGAPLHSSTGEVFGIVVALYCSPIEYSEEVAALFELFAGRISAELERLEKETALTKLNELLEQNVAYRTVELEKTILQLKQSHEQLVEQEKLASLGRLVAGVAHEVNTPLGVAVLGNSTTSSAVRKLEQKFKNGTLSKSELERFIHETKEAVEGVEFNLARASDLVGNFKQMATDFHSDEECEVNLSEWISSISNSLKPMLKKAGIALELSLPDNEIVVTTFPSRLAQVITNIFSNAIGHAYPNHFEKAEKLITLTLSGDNSQFEIEVSDNGVGMDKKTKEKILDPFFTTSRDHGGMGLGMSIVHNLVSNSLNGTLTVDTEEGLGTTINLRFTCLKKQSDAISLSFKRAIQNSAKFYSNFHERFISSDSGIKELFSTVDLQHQQNMVLQSMNLFANESDNLDAFFDKPNTHRIINMHKKMNIDHDFVMLWKDCFIQTVEEFDTAFNDDLKRTWNKKLTKFANRFVSALNQ